MEKDSRYFWAIKVDRECAITMGGQKPLLLIASSTVRCTCFMFREEESNGRIVPQKPRFDRSEA